MVLVVVPVSQPVEELAMDLAPVWLPVVVLVEGLLVVLALQPVVELVVDPSQVWSPVAVLVVVLVVALVLQHVEKLVGLVLVRLLVVVPGEGLVVAPALQPIENWLWTLCQCGSLLWNWFWTRHWCWFAHLLR